MNAYQQAIKEERLNDEQAYRNGFRYKVIYLDKTQKYFKEKPKDKDTENAYMISNLIIWD